MAGNLLQTPPETDGNISFFFYVIFCAKEYESVPMTLFIGWSQSEFLFIFISSIHKNLPPKEKSCKAWVTKYFIIPPTSKTPGLKRNSNWRNFWSTTTRWTPTLFLGKPHWTLWHCKVATGRLKDKQTKQKDKHRERTAPELIPENNVTFLAPKFGGFTPLPQSTPTGQIKGAMTTFKRNAQFLPAVY